MRYQLRQKIWSLGATYIVRDAAGNEVVRVDGRLGSDGYGDDVRFYDLASDEFARVEQRGAVRPEPGQPKTEGVSYDILSHRKTVATMSRRVGGFTPVWDILVNDGGSLKIKGDFLNMGSATTTMSISLLARIQS